MFTIRKARIDDCGLINQMAGEVFPATYQEILSPGQLDYMMDWMYSPENIGNNGRRRSCLFYRI